MVRPKLKAGIADGEGASAQLAAQASSTGFLFARPKVMIVW
jgi:hypothetical protein